MNLTKQALRDTEVWNPRAMAKRQADSLSELFTHETDWARFYAPDVMGTPEHKLAYQQGVEQVLTWWRDAPPDYPVEVVEVQKDDICKLCVNGEHCRFLVNPEHNLNNLRYEAELLTALIKAITYWKSVEDGYLKRINALMQDDTGIVAPEIFVEPIRFTDTEEILAARRIRTNKKQCS